MDRISSCTLDTNLDAIYKVKNILDQCERMANLEGKRRRYKRKLNKRTEERERKESVKPMTQWLRKKATVIVIPSLPCSQEDMDVE